MTVLFGMVSRRSSRFKWDDEGRRRATRGTPARPGATVGACGIPLGAVSALCPRSCGRAARSEFTRRLGDLPFRRSLGGARALAVYRDERGGARPQRQVSSTRRSPLSSSTPLAALPDEVGRVLVLLLTLACVLIALRLSGRPRLAVLRPRAADGAGARHRQSRSPQLGAAARRRSGMALPRPALCCRSRNGAHSSSEALRLPLFVWLLVTRRMRTAFCGSRYRRRL